MSPQVISNFLGSSIQSVQGPNHLTDTSKISAMYTCLHSFEGYLKGVAGEGGWGFAPFFRGNAIEKPFDLCALSLFIDYVVVAML